MVGSLPLPPESALPWWLPDPRMEPWAQKPKQAAGDRGGASVGGISHPGLLFKKYKVFRGGEGKEKNLYKNLFTYKILKKVQGKTQC